MADVSDSHVQATNSGMYGSGSSLKILNTANSCCLVTPSYKRKASIEAWLQKDW